MLFHSFNWLTVTPYFLLIANSVSPDTTVWVVFDTEDEELVLVEVFNEGLLLDGDGAVVATACLVGVGLVSFTIGISSPRFLCSCRLSTIPAFKSLSFLILFLDFNADNLIPYFWEILHSVSPGRTL